MDIFQAAGAPTMPPGHIACVLGEYAPPASLVATAQAPNAQGYRVLNLIRQWGHRCCGWCCDNAAMTARRIAGSVGLGGPCLFLFSRFALLRR